MVVVVVVVVVVVGRARPRADTLSLLCLPGVHVITPNKKLNSGPLAQYAALRAFQRESYIHFFYEVGFCCCFLPSSPAGDANRNFTVWRTRAGAAGPRWRSSLHSNHRGHGERERRHGTRDRLLRPLPSPLALLPGHRRRWPARRRHP